ncbi:MAG: phosphonate C-P lyase system protein PhnL [Deltaproteobacteria bacterium]|jgi:alpha-D-ribose 1-methylphosphonate 5-triphosphate synthase subunit PhnL|nr:phosphonate C-P lyase system protein PhnL [Deltaproteobacteria bacterium]
MEPILAIKAANVSKTFVLHNLGTRLPAVEDVSFSLPFGKCLAIDGPSGSGKSTLVRCLYGNCLPTAGSVSVFGENGFVDLVAAGPREIMELRKNTISHVSQFLRVIPRISALDIVAHPLIEKGLGKNEARRRAGTMLHELNIPERLFDLPPLTFSGGERQRVNIARGLIKESPVLLLDEPTASLDAPNKRIAVDLFLAAKKRGSAIVGIFHDRDVRDGVADWSLELPSKAFGPAKRNSSPPAVTL